VKTAKVTAAGLSQRIADCRSHEGRGAGRGHHHGQNAREKAAGSPAFAASEPPALVSVSPISNCPASDRPRKNSSPAISARKTGDWNWNPQPSVAPAARKPSSTATSTQKETRMPTA
jgi:hypothetical protein